MEKERSSELQEDSVSSSRNLAAEKIEKIQENYIRYLQSGEESFFQEMIQILESMCVGWIKNYLRKNNRYISTETVEEILQESRLNVWKDLNITKKENKTPRDTFGWYARGIYMNCAKKEQVYYLSNKNFANANSCSVEFMNENGITISVGNKEDSLVVSRGNRSVINRADIIKEDEILQTERRNFYGKFLEAYIRTLMDTKESPENCLAVMYTRLLPHVMGEIKDSLMSSVKWAKNQIKDQSIEELTVDSENKMIENGVPYYHWGSHYLEQLEKEICVNGNLVVLRQVKYLETYDEGRKLEHMDRDTHKAIQKETFKRILKDPELRELAVEYVEIEDRMYKIIGGDRG